MGCVLAGEVLCTCGSISHQHPREVTPGISFCRDLDETEKEERAAATKAVTEEGFQRERAASAPRVTAARPRVTAQPDGAQGPLCLSSTPLPQPGLRLPLLTD